MSPELKTTVESMDPSVTVVPVRRRHITPGQQRRVRPETYPHVLVDESGMTWSMGYQGYVASGNSTNSTNVNVTAGAVTSVINLKNSGVPITYLSFTMPATIVGAGNITGANQTISGDTVSYEFGTPQTTGVSVPVTSEGGFSFANVTANNGTVPFSVCQAEGMPATSQTLGYLVNSVDGIPVCHDTSPINTVIVERPVNADGRLPMNAELSQVFSMVLQGVRQDKRHVMMYTGNFSDLAINPVLGEQFRKAFLKENKRMAGVYQLGFNPQDLAEDNAYFIATLLQGLPLGSLPMVVVPNSPVAATFKGIFSWNQTATPPMPLNVEYVINANGLPLNATAVLETMSSLGNDGRITVSLSSAALASSTAAVSQLLAGNPIGVMTDALGRDALALCEMVAGVNASTCGRPQPQPSPSVTHRTNNYDAPIWGPILAIVAILAALLLYRRHKHGSFFGAAVEGSSSSSAFLLGRRPSDSD